MQSLTKNPQSRARIETLARHAFDGVGLAEGFAGLRELTDGWFNAVYDLTLADGRTVILKVAPRPDAPVMTYERELMATEVASLRLLRADPAIPVPRVLFHDDSRTRCDAPYFFMDKVAGTSLDHLRGRLPLAEVAAIDRHMGQIVRAINGFPGEWFGIPGNPALQAPTWRAAFETIVESLLEDGARRAVAYPCSPARIRTLLRRHLPVLDEVHTPCLVNWDGWDSNIFVADSRVTGLIDFERALWAEPLMEAQFRALSWTGVSEAMRGYGRTAFSPDELRRCRLYTLHLALVMYTECHYRHYPGDKILNVSRDMMVANLDWLDANG